MIVPDKMNPTEVMNCLLLEIKALRREFNELKEALWKAELEHAKVCEAKMGEVYSTIARVKEVVDQMVGAKVNPYWIYALLTAAGILVGYLSGMRIGH